MGQAGSDLPVVFPSVVHALADAAAQSPGHEALVMGEERLNYREYLRCVAGFSRELETLGLNGCRVALLMGNSIDVCIAMFAVHAARAEAVPLNPVYTARELLPMLEDAEVSAVIFDEALADVVRDLAAELQIKHLFAIGSDYRLTEWRARSDLDTLGDLPEAQDPATLQFTGGTTGRAKGACISHYSLSVNVSQREAISPTRDDVERTLCIMPLFHCYAVSMCLHAMVFRRGALVILPRYHPGEVIAALVRERITLFAGSPTIFTGLLNYPGFPETDFSNLYMSSSGSAPLAENVLDEWERITGTPILEGYGQSEAGPVITFNPLDGVRKPTSVGIPLPATDIQVVDLETGTKVLETGQNGEIRVAGPQVMRGYRNRPDETALALRDGWLYTGDIGEIDEDGYLYIRARKKEMLIVSGYNVFPREVEEILHRNPGVREAAVVAKKDAYRGELPVAFIVPGTENGVDEDVLRHYCTECLASYKIPAEFHFVESLPKTVVGKVDKILLAEMANRNPESRHSGECRNPEGKEPPAAFNNKKP